MKKKENINCGFMKTFEKKNIHFEYVLYDRVFVVEFDDYDAEKYFKVISFQIFFSFLQFDIVLFVSEIFLQGLILNERFSEEYFRV
jgi:hypothetical protein